MSLEDLNPFDYKVIVFIADLSPSDEERALAEEHGTTTFRYAGRKEWCYPIDKHRYAVAVDPKLIPEGYKTYSPQGTVPDVPVANPTQPPRKAGGKRAAPIVSGEDI